MKRLAAILFALLFPIAIAAQLAGQTSKVAGPVFEGQELTCDLPPQEQFRNIGSKVDGAGMCVNSSIEMAARAQGLEQMRGYRDWTAQIAGGGSYPDKVDKQLAQWF